MLLALLALTMQDASYEKQILDWRAESEARLKADDGWLTVAGLFWLKQGPNTFGSAESNDIVLPASAPAQAGVFHFDGKRVTHNGKVLAANPPTLVEIGPLTMFVIERGDRAGIRLRDKNSQFRREFTHRSWYPVQPAYRIEGKLIPEPRKYNVATVIPDVFEEYETPGVVEFTLHGQTVRLRPMLTGDQYFYIFRDTTAGKGTYPAGRFLYSDPAKDGKVILDFNKAYNPPCAFTPYATCPLPPKENRLPLAIEAGELDYGKH